MLAVCAVLLGTARLGAAQPQQATYEVIDLGTLGGSQSLANSINNSGQVVGFARTANGSIHAFLWQNGAMSDLGTLVAGNFSTAADINESGQVVGQASINEVPGVSNGCCHAFLWQNGAMSDLGTFVKGNFSAAGGINESGQVVGFAAIATGATGFNHAFLSQNGVMSDLGTLGGTISRAFGINKSGQVVGNATIATGFNHAFLWQNGEMSDLGTLGGNSSQAFRINNSGQVVGNATIATGSNHAFLWQNGAMSDLGTLGGTTSGAGGINESGQVVGFSATANVSSHAFLWQNGVMKDLNDLIDPNSGWVLSSAQDINNKGEIVGSGRHNGADHAFLLRPSRRPVLIIPGVGATYAADPNNDLFWLTHRGVDPKFLQIDPLARTYHDLIETLKRVGYVDGKDLFVVNYDWRLPPGPDDNGIDGKISGLTASSISARNYLYAVDYLGDMLKRAAERWEGDHPGEPPLDAVDVITHSTGGLVARTYIQSDAYGGVYKDAKTLPKINNLIMIGVPNRGASKAWNPLHDNWGVDPAFRMVLSKIINRAFRQVIKKGKVISGPDYNISLASISAPNCADKREICFIRQYVPTARALLATYDFIDFGSGFTNVNGDLAARNSLVLDLNAGLDRETGVVSGGDPNAFADKVLAKVTVIYGTNGGSPLVPVPLVPSTTPTRVVKQVGPVRVLGVIPPVPVSFPIAEFSSFKPRAPENSEIYYSDEKDPDSGDGTVPLESSIGQFLLDSRLNSRIILRPFTANGNTQESVDHTSLPFNIDVQKSMLQTLGVPFNDPTDISTNLHQLAGTAIACAVTGCLNIILDPVEGFLVDAQGRRLGFTTATGRVTEIPGSVWFGNADGIGWVFGPVVEPLRLELTGLGEPHYVMVSMLTPAGNSGMIDEGVLGVGAKRALTIPLSSVTSATVPGAPVISTVTAGNAQVSVVFTAPASNGGSAITSYRATASPGGIEMNGANSPIQVTGLTNGAPYTFTVTATNSAGTGPPSTPSDAVAPMTPTGVPPRLAGPVLEKWSDSAFPVSWRLNPAKGANVTGSRELVEIFRLAAASWDGVATAQLSFSEGLPTTVTGAAFDQINSVSVMPAQFGSDLQSLTVLYSFAEAGVDLFGRTIEFPGQILEADILFNPAVQFSTDVATPAGKIDFQSLAAHEMGHLLGLDHSGLLSAVMSPARVPGTSHLRALSTDDVIRVSSLYPTSAFFTSRGSSSGVVRNAGGSPIFGAQVVIVDSSGRPVTTTITDPDGVYQVHGLEPGNYSSYVEPLDQPLIPGAVPSLGRIYPGTTAAVDFTTRFATTSAATVLTLTKTTGDNQRENIGKVLPVPLEVQVRDSAGNPVVGVSVFFTATGGGGTIAPIRATTDTEGKARTRAYLGTGATQTFRASVASVMVTFTATQP